MSQSPHHAALVGKMVRARIKGATGHHSWVIGILVLNAPGNEGGYARYSIGPYEVEPATMKEASDDGLDCGR